MIDHVGRIGFIHNSDIKKDPLIVKGEEEGSFFRFKDVNIPSSSDSFFIISRDSFDVKI